MYTGVTADLIKRIYEHREKLVEGFSSRYNCRFLVYYEVFDDVNNAIAREKQIKGRTRARKEELIKTLNPEWKDLYEDICR